MGLRRSPSTSAVPHNTSGGQRGPMNNVSFGASSAASSSSNSPSSRASLSKNTSYLSPHLSTNNNTKNRKKISMRKAVSFDSVVKCRTTVHVNDIPQDQRNAMWRTQQEEADSHDELWNTIDVMDAAIDELSDATANLYVDEVNYSKRGLEAHTKVGEDIRNENRSAAISAVLEAQAQGITDPKVLAAVYRRESQHTQMAAYLMARHDEQAVARQPQQSSLSQKVQSSSGVNDSNSLLPSTTFQELLSNLRQSHQNGEDFASVLSRYQANVTSSSMMEKRRSSQSSQLKSVHEATNGDEEEETLDTGSNHQTFKEPPASTIPMVGFHSPLPSKAKNSPALRGL